MARLRVTSAVLSGAVFELAGNYFTIGREPDNSICLHHPSVSKHHAMLKIDAGVCQLFDLHSTNGIIVNGETTIVAHLREGDRIVLGEVELQLEPDLRDATQRLSPLPPFATHTTTAPPPVPKPQPKVAPDAPASPRPGTFSSLLTGLRRPPPVETPEPEPPSRDEIHADLNATLGKMGIEIPKPPPAHAPTVSSAHRPTPIKLPPLSKPGTPDTGQSV